MNSRGGPFYFTRGDWVFRKKNLSIPQAYLYQKKKFMDTTTAEK